MGRTLILIKRGFTGMKNSKIWLIVSGGLAGIFIILAVSAFVSYIGNAFSVTPSQMLTDGAVVHVEQRGTYRIFIEDIVPPLLSRHDFTFINTVTGERVESIAPDGNMTYTAGGIQGRLVANVTLEPGSYVVEFEPWEGGGVFVWGDNINLFVGSMIRYILLSFLAGIFSVLFIVLLALHIKRKRDAETAAFFEKIRHTGN